MPLPPDNFLFQLYADTKENIPPKFKKLFIFLVFIVVLYLAFRYLGSLSNVNVAGLNFGSENSNDGRNSAFIVGNNNTVNLTTDLGLTGKQSICEGPIFFSENSLEWDTSFFEGPKEDGYYTPSGFKSASNPDMSFLRELPLTNIDFEINYYVLPPLQNPSEPPLSIFSIGQGSNRIARFYINDSTPRVVGLELYTEEGNIRPLELSDSLDYVPISNKEMKLSVKSTLKENRQVNFKFRLDYMAEIEGNIIDTFDEFSYDIEINTTPDPKSSSTFVGFGTSTGHFVKITSYKICL